MQQLVRLIYALFIAASLITFVTLGVTTFYEGPKYPDYPDTTISFDEARYQKEQDEYKKSIEIYDDKDKSYQRNVAIIILPIATITAALGIYLFKRSRVIGEGIALGAAGVAIYGIYAATQSEVKILTFLSVTILLATSILVAWRQFSGQDSNV